MKVIDFYHYDLECFKLIKGMTSLRVLRLDWVQQFKMDMAVIESLPNLIEITGLYPPDQSDDSFLDKLFASCGHSLQKLDLVISEEGVLPQAFKRKSTLKTLKLRSYEKLNILPSDVI